MSDHFKRVWELVTPSYEISKRRLLGIPDTNMKCAVTLPDPPKGLEQECCLVPPETYVLGYLSKEIVS